MSADNRSEDATSSPRAVRAATLGRRHFGFDPSRSSSLPGAMAASDGDRAIAVVESPTMAVVGGVLLWAQQSSADLEAIIVDGEAGAVDAWMDGFEARPDVHGLDGQELVEPARPAAEAVPPAPPVPPEFDAADVEVVIERGVVLAEVDGLEVARATIGDDGGVRIEVGVGLYDRAAHDMMSRRRPVGDTLADVVARVSAVRGPDAGAHAFNRLGRERWLRSSLVARPRSIGLVDARPVDPLPARTSLLDACPAPATGVDEDGATVLVVATAGVDPGLAVSTAALAQREGTRRIVVVLPGRDRLAPVERLLTRLRWPVELVEVDPPWNGQD